MSLYPFDALAPLCPAKMNNGVHGSLLRLQAVVSQFHVLRNGSQEEMLKSPGGFVAGICQYGGS